MLVAVFKEAAADERRVALIPASVAALAKAGFAVAIERGAGAASGHSDDAYAGAGATLFDVEAPPPAIDVVAAVGVPPIDRLRRGQTVIGLLDPLNRPSAAQAFARAGVAAFALELVPRITRAQSMDVLSSMATIAGYRAVLRAADKLPRLFPLLMTAAGTVAAAKVLVLGAGVAGLQAIATARRLGATVRAYDVRPAVKEQVLSLGAKFVELPLDVASAEDKGGYAKALGDEFYRRQRELLADVVAECDVVIATAAIPGQRSPLLITAAAVERMAPGSVVVDLAAERGGNCELTRPNETVVHRGVTIEGPTNLPSEAACHASQLYAKNVTTFLLHVFPDGRARRDASDEIVRETLLADRGEVVHPRVRALLQLPPLSESEAP